MALDAEIRIPDTTLQDNDFKDGEILRGSDVNKIVSVLKAGVNENYKDLKESDTVSNEHILDEVRHITGQERDRWNNTYTKEELYTKEEVYNKSEVYNKNETYPKESLYTKEETYSKSETYPKESLYTKNEVYKKSETYPKENLYTKNEVYTKEEVYTKGETYSKNDVYTKDNVYTKSEVDRQINDRITEIGSADMQKAVYDTNSNGIVDNSERLGGQLPSYYAPKTDVSTLQTNVSALQTNVSTLQTDVSELQEKSYEIYNDESTLETNGSLIRNMVIFGKSVQDGTPTPDNPIEIKSVVNPKVTVCGKNLLNSILGTTTLNGVTCTNNGDGTYTLNGTGTNSSSYLLQNMVLKKGITYKVIGSNDTYSMVQIRDSSDNILCKSNNNNNGTLCPSKDISVNVKIAYVKNNSFSNAIIKPMITTDLNATYDDFEPYKGQSATLPYTLNAIPVSSGGNVTIDGQQYISDYVDIERKKLVRKLQYRNISSLDKSKWEFRTDINSVNATKYKGFGGSFVTDCNAISNIMPRDTGYVANTFRMVDTTYYLFQFNLDKTQFPTVEDWTNYLTNNDVYIIYELATPTEIDLTDEEVSQFKALQTYVPTSNIIASSDVLAPKVEFNYNFSKGIDDLYRSDIDIKSDVSTLQSDLATHTHKSIAFSGYNPIKSTTDDTVENWKTIGTSIHSYDLKGSLIDQPAQWGTLITMVDGSNVSQIWLTRPSGYLFTRSGNQNGWSGTWKRYGAMSYDSSTNTLNITL